jgi:hypothetical protein
MASKTSICNKALRKLGEPAVLDIETDDRTSASICNASFEDVLTEVLREHPWNFAVTRAALNKDAGTPLYEFSSQYVLPTTPPILRLLCVENNIDYSLEGGFLFTNTTENTINIKYLAFIDNVSKFDSSFVEALAARLAWEIAYAVTGKPERVQALQQEYIQTLRLAKENDAQENTITPIDESRWSLGRFRSSSRITTNIDVDA